MSTARLTPREIEQERREEADSFAADAGEGWAEDCRPGSSGCHELLDRTSLLADMLERHVVSHPACVANPDWYRLARQAAEHLHELYQQVGAEHLAAPVNESQDGK